MGHMMVLQMSVKFIPFAEAIATDAALELSHE